MKFHLHVLVAACLMLAAPNAFAGGNLTCPELQETEEFSSSKFQPPGQRGAKAPDPNAVPMRIRWEYEPAGLEENPHDHQLHRKCIMRMRLDIRIDRRIASDIAAIFQPYSICEAKISTGVGGWLARGEHSLQADTHLQVKIKKCGTHIWTECHDVWKCSKTRRPYTIDLGELDVTLRALLLASAPEGVGQLDVDSVARVGDVKYTLPGDIGARVPQAVVDLIVPDAFDSALESGVDSFATQLAGPNISGGRPCMQSGGWNGGAAICIRDPTYADKHYFEFDPATFAVTNGVWQRTIRVMHASPTPAAKCIELGRSR